MSHLLAACPYLSTRHLRLNIRELNSRSPLADLFLPCPHPSGIQMSWMLRCPCSPSHASKIPSPVAKSGGSLSEPALRSTCLFPSLLSQPWTWPPSPVRKVTAARLLQAMPPDHTSLPLIDSTVTTGCSPNSMAQFLQQQQPRHTQASATMTARGCHASRPRFSSACYQERLPLCQPGPSHPSFAPPSQELFS